MRKGEITETMIRQSKEIWELLKPGEFVPEPGDWVVTSGSPVLFLRYMSRWDTALLYFMDQTTRVYEVKGFYPIFTFSHCLDLLRGLGCEFHIAIVNKASKEVTLSFWYTSYTVGHGNNLHECAQSVLLKVLKGES